MIIKSTNVVKYRGVAQLVEHRSPKPGVAGSNPVAPAIQSTNPSDIENTT
jgi:hypothetical protein